MTTPKQCVIVTVTYNSEGFIDEFLQAVEDELTTSALVIVDNDSADKTLDVIEQFKSQSPFSSSIEVVANAKNIGFGSACNIGAQTASKFSPEFLWFLNPDTKIFPNSGGKLRECLQTQPAAGFCGSLLVDNVNTPRPSAYNFHSALTEFLSAIRLGILDKLFASKIIPIPVGQKRPHQVGWVTGASFMCRLNVFEALKGFDEVFFLYFEEVDLFFRAKKMGFQVWHSPESRVYHFAGASTGLSSQRSEHKRRPAYWFESRRRFFVKSYGRIHAIFADIGWVIGHILGTCRDLVLRRRSDLPPQFCRDLIKHSVIFHPKLDRD